MTIEIAQYAGGGDPLTPNQVEQPNTYYQMLEVHPPSKEEKRVGKTIATTIVAKKRGTGDINNLQTCSFDDYELDGKTKEKLRPYPKHGDDNLLSSYLPSSGIVFPRDFMRQLRQEGLNKNELNNFYDPLRSILISRKMSQLIAKTWWTYLKAKETDLWDQFAAGEWDDIDTDILDGLIAREILILAGGDSPDNPDPEDPNIYVPLTASDKGRFLILPSSKSWQGINLSLLFSGQAYYKRTTKYHQISQPILSTGEIVLKYSFESDWSKFNGEFKELATNQKSPWIVYQVIIPYPPIPSEKNLDPEDIKKWAQAKDEGGDLPFYKKEGDNYLMDVDYFKSPYPYIPLSTT